MDIAIRLTAFAVLIAFTAFFVASEFAIVKVRTTRIDQLLAEGNKKAINAKKVVSNLDEYLSACQLGITITALGLGWLGEPTIERILHPAFEYFELPESVSSLLSFIIAFSLVTYIHVVVGELTPKTFAIQRSEQITLAVAKPLVIFDKIMYPVIHGMNGSARFLATKVFGLEPVSESEVAHSEEELRMILSDSFKGGEINQAEYKYVNKIFEFDDRIAKEIMVPRTEITSIDKDLTLSEVFEVVGVEQFTRYPVTDDKDHIIGLVNMKNLLTAFIRDPANATTPVADYMQPIIRVIENMPIADLLLKIQRERIHMAILMDEYGGTSGLVTIEDIIEEIVGDIRDEFDTDELPEVQKVAENHYIIDAKMLIESLNDLLNINIDEEDIDTIGGWFMTKSYDVVSGEKLLEQGYEFTVKEIDGHHIQYLEVVKVPEDQEDEELEESIDE